MSDDKLVSDTLSGDTSNRRSEPSYCQYCRGGCDQDFSEIEEATGLFLYPSHPEIISSTIETAKETLSTLDPKLKWITWKNLPVVGQTIFCTICKAVRFSGAVICDVTTMNFNLMFEIGYAIGLEVPIVPIRDTTILTDKDDFGRLGLLDTIGYLDFQNSEQLATKIMERMPFSPLKFSETELNTSSPIYMVKSPIPTEGEVRLLSVWKKSHFRFRTYDSVETPRLSLHEAIKEIDASLGVVGHLLSPAREGAKVHNARVALFAGIAMALGKHVVLVQEGHVEQPIDYREIVLPYNNPNELEKMFEPFMLSIMEKMQEGKRREKKTSPRFLARLDLGDVAAENEIQALSSYFVPTAQFSEVKRGHARLVIGRKGTGKTAMFYALRNASHKGHSNLVLDLKPDGHQFTKLRETVLSALPAGLQEHTLVGFWNLILLSVRRQLSCPVPRQL